MTSLVESFYGLKKPPFTTSASSGPVFMTEPLRAAAQFVRRGLNAGKAIQCVGSLRIHLSFHHTGRRRPKKIERCKEHAAPRYVVDELSAAFIGRSTVHRLSHNGRSHPAG